MLYPIKFHPQYKYRIWGGSKLANILGKKNVPEKTGESWELSAVQGSLSVVSNGFLAGNTIEELAEIYMGDLLGDQVYQRFGVEFPLLIKLIDANDILSIQVHPDDALAKSRHNAYGKTEMWFVIQADEGAELISGFNRDLSKAEFIRLMDAGQLESVLNREKVTRGDCFFIPAGRVHATGAGILFAEIQQTSDITYRIYDWNRIDQDGKPRDLHLDLALDAIDYASYPDYKTQYMQEPNLSNPVVDCPFFTTRYLHLSHVREADFVGLDSFIIYMCLKGQVHLEYHDNRQETAAAGEILLVPASLKSFRLKPDPEAELLEVFMNYPVEE